MKKHLLITLASLVLLSSCRKDPVLTEDQLNNDPFQLEFVCPEVDQNSNSSITLGDTTGMIVHHYQDTVGYSNVSDEYHYYAARCTDMQDIQFSYWYFDGPGPSNSYGMRFSSINGLKFRAEPNGYQEFHIEDTSYNNTNPVYMVVQNDISCQSNGTPPILIEDQPLYFDGGELLSITDSFSSDGNIYRPTWNMPASVNDLGNDTTLVKTEVYFRNCNNINLSMPQYIGLLMDVDAQQKLGWIKITADSSIGANIIIEEIAVQR